MNIRNCATVVIPASAVMLAGWSFRAVVTADSSVWSRVAAAEITPEDAMVLVHAVLLVATFLLLVEFVRSRFRRRHRRDAVPEPGLARPAGLLILGLAVAPGGPAIESAHVATVVPAGTMVSPAIAVAVVERILRRRREQIRRNFAPDRLTNDEATTLAEVMRTAASTSVPSASECDVDEAVRSRPEVAALVAGVERPLPTFDEQFAPGGTGDWLVRLKVLGHPCVENRQGQRATFRKGRSLELLTWLALNRDRSRRSAARTAMWEYDVTDSTFSTVVSEMRRALNEIAVLPDGSTWCPATFSDEMVLSELLVTDADELALSMRRLMGGMGTHRDVVRELVKIRDVPFAGTAYSWADLDGSTTRLVVSVVDAVREVVRVATEAGDTESVVAAASAGLRVVPGSGEFLDILDTLRPGRRPRGHGAESGQDESVRLLPTLGR